MTLSRRLMFESKTRMECAPETRTILGFLGVTDYSFHADISDASPPQTELRRLLNHCAHCYTEFGRDLLADVDPANPRFYSRFEKATLLQHLVGVPGVTAAIFDDPASLLFP